MALRFKNQGRKFLLTQMQFTPYNKLPFSCKGKFLNDLGFFLSLIYRIFQSTPDPYFIPFKHIIRQNFPMSIDPTLGIIKKTKFLELTW